MNSDKLDALSLEELYTLADKTGLDLPPGLDRPFVVEEILEVLEEDSEDRRAEQGEAVHIDEKKYSGLRIGDFDLVLGPDESLATRYNETMIRAIARDPSWAFAYWDVSDSEIEALRGEDSTAGLFLRVAEIGPPGEQSDGQREYFDIPVADNDLQWYINLPRSGVRFRIDLCARERAARAGSSVSWRDRTKSSRPGKASRPRPGRPTPRATSSSRFPAWATFPSTTLRTAIRCGSCPPVRRGREIASIEGQRMKKAYLAFVLNAHMPFVRRPEYPRFLEERWLFEVISETYLPLLRVFRSLEADSVPFHLTLSVSPTLAAMLGDKALVDRYAEYLESQLRLAGAEEARVGGDPDFAPLPRMYRELYSADKADFDELYGRDILSAMDFYYKKGRVELMTSGATHAFLPIFRDCREAVTSQVETAIISHRKAFGKHPAGFWLPQLGWYPGVADLLRSYNVQYTVVTTKGAMLGEPTPRYGSFAPVECPSGLVAFIRDAGATKAVWSESSGYPADPAYRDFYRDIGFDLPADYLDAHLENPGERIFTGFKYWAVTGRTQEKRPYDPVAAAAKAAAHASHFLAERRAAATAAAALMDRPPLMVCPFDAELLTRRNGTKATEPPFSFAPPFNATDLAYVVRTALDNAVARRAAHSTTTPSADEALFAEAREVATSN